MILNYSQHKEEINSKIRNLDSLPGGLRCNYLLTIKGHNNTLIAKQWKRKKPKNIGKGEVLIVF